MLKKLGVKERQLITVPLSELYGEGMDLRHGPFFIKAVPTLHEGAQYADVQNLMLLIRFQETDAGTGPGESRLLIFAGDSAPEERLFERMAQEGKADWLFAPFPYFGRTIVRRKLKKHLQPLHLFALHLPLPEKDTAGWIPSAKKICGSAADALPAPVFPVTPGREPCQSWIL